MCLSVFLCFCVSVCLCVCVCVIADFSEVSRPICTKLGEWSQESDAEGGFFQIFDISTMTLKKGHFTIYGHMSITLELSTIEM